MLDKTVEKPTMGELHLLQRKRLTDTHLELMQKIIEENSHKEKYWILGTAKCKRKHGRTTIRPVLKAYDVQPDIQKEHYLYEVDNKLGIKNLLWVMHPNNKLTLPTLGKCISAASDLA